MIASVVIVLIVAVLVILDIRYIFGQKKQGKCIGCSESGCGCNSASCPTAEKFTKYHEQNAK